MKRHAGRAKHRRAEAHRRTKGDDGLTTLLVGVVLITGLTLLLIAAAWDKLGAVLDILF